VCFQKLEAFCWNFKLLDLFYARIKRYEQNYATGICFFFEHFLALRKYARRAFRWNFKLLDTFLSKNKEL